MYDPICQPRSIEVVGNVLIASCPNGVSPAVECRQSPREYPCGYAEGLSAPHYPVPAIPTHIEYRPNGEAVLFETYDAGEVAIYRIGDWQYLYNW